MEIEQKFIVNGDDWKSDVQSGPVDIHQSYVPAKDDSSIRIHLRGSGNARHLDFANNHTFSHVLIPENVWDELADNSKDRLFADNGEVIIDDTLEVRIRIKNNSEAWLAIKADSPIPNARHELEFPISLSKAERLRDTYTTTHLHKMRHEIPVQDGKKWEVDVYQRGNVGLVTAEMETDTPPPSPKWLGQEVTNLRRYSSRALAAHPFTQWGEQLRGACMETESGHKR